MTDRPILFSAPMVRALRDGRKTQTRRMLKLPPAPDHLGEWQASTIGGPGVYDDQGRETPEFPCVWHTRNGATVVPRFATGDRLWVKETWRIAPDACEGWPPDAVPCPGWVDYRAGGNAEVRAPSFSHVLDAFGKKSEVDWDCLPDRWRPSLFMTRWASRLTLTVTEVRIERLQACSEEDAVAEGLEWVAPGKWSVDRALPIIGDDPRRVYAELWDHINGEGAWQANPWVVAVSFDVREGNIDG